MVRWGFPRRILQVSCKNNATYEVPNHYFFLSFYNDVRLKIGDTELKMGDEWDGEQGECE